MEEVLRENDQMRTGKRRLHKDDNKSEYKMKIAREKLEANMFTRKMQDLERQESALVEKLEHTQDQRRNMFENYN